MHFSEVIGSIVIPVQPFLVHFFLSLYVLKAVLFFLFILVLLGAYLLSHFEKIKYSEAVYFAIITGFTIGYGDYVPKRPLSRLVSICMGLVGLLFTGIIVAACVHSVEAILKELVANKPLLQDIAKR